MNPPYKNTRPAPEDWDPAQPNWSLLSLTVAARKWLNTRPDVDVDAILDGLRADGVLAQNTPRGATWLRTNTHDILVDMAAASFELFASSPKALSWSIFHHLDGELHPLLSDQGLTPTFELELLHGPVATWPILDGLDDDGLLSA